MRARTVGLLLFCYATFSSSIVLRHGSAEWVPGAHDILPYDTVMMGIASMEYSSDVLRANCTVAATVHFHTSCDAADVAVFIQIAEVGEVGDRRVSTVYRHCLYEVFTISTTETRSNIAFEAAHDPLACLSRTLLSVAVPDPFLPVNLTAVAHPYEPTRLLVLTFYQGWSLSLYPKMTFAEFLEESRGGPVSFEADDAVAFCTSPSGLFGEWTARVLFFGAYNLLMSVTAIKPDSSATDQENICTVDYYGRHSPLVFRLNAGRLDVAPAPYDAVVDTLNGTLRCISGDPSLDAYLFVVDTSLWIVTSGAAVELTPDRCWESDAFGKPQSLVSVVGRSYAGGYGPLSAVALTIDSVTLLPKDTSSSRYAVNLSGAFGADGFVRDCRSGSPPVTVEFDANAAELYDLTSCLGQAILAVGMSFWLRLEYIPGADAFWVSLSSGSFLATRAPHDSVSWISG